MKKTFLFLFILWPFFATFGQDNLEDPSPEVRLGERLTAFLQKNTEAVPQKEPSFLLPENLLTTGMAEYRISREMKDGTNAIFVYFFYRKRAAILIACYGYNMAKATDVFSSLKKKYGHYSSRTIYKGPDFNRSGCPTQEVTYWADKNQTFYFIYMPEFQRCQFILADTKIQDRLKAERNEALLKKLR